MTPQLLSNASDLAHRFGISGQAVGAVLLRDGVQPAYVSNDKKTVLYNAEAATAAVQKYVDAKRAAVTPPAAAPAAPPKPVYATGDLVDAINAAVSSAVSELLGDFMTELQALDTAARERDRQLFKAVEALKATLLPAPAPVVVEPVAAPVAEVKPPKPDKPATQRRVLIVGLLNAQVEMIRKEFSECFRLTFVASDETKGHGFDAQITSADHVIMMTAFCNHGLERVLKRKEKDLRRISGGMSSLRNALTELYVSTADKVAA